MNDALNYDQLRQNRFGRSFASDCFDDRQMRESYAEIKAEFISTYFARTQNQSSANFSRVDPARIIEFIIAAARKNRAGNFRENKRFVKSCPQSNNAENRKSRRRFDEQKA